MKTMFRIATLALTLVLAVLTGSAADVQTPIDAEYCFCQGDFSDNQALQGIFVTQVPAPEVALVRLGDRLIQPGDVLPTDRLEDLRLVPTCAVTTKATVTYYPIAEGVLDPQGAVTVGILSGKNELPKAHGDEFETYRNIANDGTLTGEDPEGAPLTFQLVDAPRRGTLELSADGHYVYTPKKNKVGEDSFTFTVTDEAGNVSKPATVRIHILKPSQKMTFADLEGSTDLFEAMWMAEQSLAGGRQIAGRTCFCPAEPVSRAEFLVMAMELAGLCPDGSLTVSGFSDADQASCWVQPYLAEAMRAGIVHGSLTPEGLCFRPNEAITGQEAAVLLQNILQLPVSVSNTTSTGVAWADEAVQALQEAGLPLEATAQPLSRLEVARLLYGVSQVK